MKTKEQQIEAKLKTFRSSLKLHVAPHMNLPNAVNSFMIFSGTEAKPTAFIVGGIQAYILADDMTRIHYPSVFKSRKAANDHIETDFWSDQSIKKRIAAYEAELRGV